VKRGDYDYNHTLLTSIQSNLWMIIIIILIISACLGGLFLGLTLID
jgi:hypothetical protein